MSFRNGEQKRSALAPPNCKICQHAHWFREPHIFGNRTTAVAAAKERVAKLEKEPQTRKKPRKALKRKKARR